MSEERRREEAQDSPLMFEDSLTLTSDLDSDPSEEEEAAEPSQQT